jgi:hypothetical protein
MRFSLRTLIIVMLLGGPLLALILLVATRWPDGFSVACLFAALPTALTLVAYSITPWEESLRTPVKLRGFALAALFGFQFLALWLWTTLVSLLALTLLYLDMRAATGPSTAAVFTAFAIPVMVSAGCGSLTIRRCVCGLADVRYVRTVVVISTILCVLAALLFLGPVCEEIARLHR